MQKPRVSSPYRKKLMSTDSLFSRLEAFPSDIPFMVKAMTNIQNAKSSAFRTQNWINEQGKNTVSLTFGDFSAQVQLYAKVLMSHQELKLTKGDSAVLMFEPGIQFYVTILACFYAGIIVVPIYPPFPPNKASEMEKVRRILSDFLPGLPLGKKMIILCSKLISSSIEMAKMTQIFSGDPVWKWVQSQKFLNIDSFVKESAISELLFVLPPPPCADDIAFIQYTSGSTGQPKGVINKYCHVLENCRQMNSVSDAKLFRPDGKRERLLSWLPQYHDYGLIGVFLFHGIYAGAELNLMSPFTFIQKPLLWMEKVSELRITATASPNFGFALALKKSKESQASGVMLKLDLSSLRFLSCGAEPIQAPMISDFMAFFNGHGLGTVFSPCYGLAEHVLGATSAFPGVDMKVQDNRVSCGTPLPGVTLRIVDHESLREVPDGETGEIWIDGDSKSGGYWNNPELTSETFHAELEACPGKKFLRTGDLGFLKDGEIYVSGRLKDVVIVQGRNFFANDIEHAALVSQGKMLRPGSIAAFSVDSKDPSSPEHLVIVVEVKDSLMKASAQTLLEVAAGITNDVSTIMGISPSFVVLVKPKSVPKTTSGKIMRRATRELYQENKLASVYTFPQHISVTGNASKSKTGIIQKMRSFFQTTSSPIKRNDSAVNFVSQNPGDSDASVTFISQVEMCSIEKQVASVWSNVLGIPTTSISSDSDFFALGGTSMQAIMVLNKLNQDYSPGFEGITILMFAARPTVSGLADLWTVAPMSRVAESALTKEEALKEYFDEIESLDDMIINADGAAVPFDISRIAGNSSTILLTGANGFVGSGIYYSFKKHNSSVRVICHVRAKTKELGAIRVKEAVAFYHGEWNAAWPEPEVVVGDIAEPQLGVSVDDWEFLATAVDLIIHNAAKVDFVLPYQSLRKTNVVSTVEVLRLASVTKVKGVVFMSSASAVQPKSSAFANGTPEDVALENLAGDFFFGYGQTKNISEVLCQKARTRGIPTVSIRVGFVGGSSQTFITNYDMTWDFIKTMKEKQISLIDNSFIQITPVDFLADSITALCLTPEFWGKPCVHLCPAIETCISWTQLSRLLKLSDSRNRSMPADVFTTIMMRECKDPRSPLFPFSEAIEAMAVTKFKQSWLVPSDILNQSQRIPNATDLWVGYLTHFFSSMETPDTTSKNLPIQTPL